MGNSHGSNAATAGRVAAATTQQSAQQSSQPAASAATGARLSEERAQRAVSRSQRAVATATRAYTTAQERERRARNEANRLRATQYDARAYDAQHAADLRRATRLGTQSHPDLVGRVGDARRAYQERLREARQLQARATRVYNAQQRAPRGSERARQAQTELRQLQRDLGRAQTALGYAIGRQGDAEHDLIRATLGHDDQSRISDAEARARTAGDATRAAGQRLHDARQSLDDALLALDLAQGGTGVRSHADAQTLAIASGLFNRPMTIDDFAKMVGAKPGDQVRLGGSGATLSLAFDGHGREASMTFTRASDGKLTAHVGWATTLRGANAARSTNAGRDLIRSMQAMHDLGVQRVRATAGGYGRGAGSHSLGSGMNGYYTWAKMGFTGSLSSATAHAASAHFGTPLRTVQAVMQQPGGAAWWKANGHQFDATFNWSNSYSRSTFERMAAAVNRGSNA